MRLRRDDFFPLRGSIAVCALLVLGGAACVYTGFDSLQYAKLEIAAAQAERDELDARFKRVRDEENEIRERNVLFGQLLRRGIVGEERRLDWAELMDSLRETEHLLDMRYEIAPQRILFTMPGHGFQFAASRMTLRIRLLHEEDLLRLIDGLRQKAPALIAARSCAVSRLVGEDKDEAARLIADCRIDWVTIKKTGAP